MKRIKITHTVQVTKDPEKGCAIVHPEHGLVFITEGHRFIGGRVSNHFYWRKIKKDGLLDKKSYNGYWNFEP